jgi:hypothetical protein
MDDPHLHDRAAANPAVIDTRLDARAVTFENPTGARGAGGTAAGGRKGAPQKAVAAGERVVLADLDGPGVARHLWMTFYPAPPEVVRALILEVFYDGATEPSISVPCLDFFGLPHGRPAPYASAVMTAPEGRGFNSFLPMPFRQGLRVELWNASDRPTSLYYQLDYTLQPELPDDLGYLHVTFNRENPTTLRRDFVIADGLRGPGRFLGCNVGVRIIDAGAWYGEGEVKVYRDGDTDLPTICGTGLEDYVGSAWGLGRFDDPYTGTPQIVARPEWSSGMLSGNPDFVGFYRWHLPDPIMFTTECRVTIQQIGFALFLQGQQEEFEAYERTNPAAGNGWTLDPDGGVIASGIAERVDDYCATAYLYCTTPQGVPRVDVPVATADIERRPYEQPSPFERLLGAST